MIGEGHIARLDVCNNTVTSELCYGKPLWFIGDIFIQHLQYTNTAQSFLESLIDVDFFTELSLGSWNTGGNKGV